MSFIFLGCRWHGCSCQNNDIDKNASKTKRKRESLKKMGYKVVTMKECDWDKLIKEDHVKQVPTRMANILKSDDEASLLEAIRNDQIFGYVRCSVKSPESFIERLEKEWYRYTMAPWHHDIKNNHSLPTKRNRFSSRQSSRNINYNLIMQVR